MLWRAASATHFDADGLPALGTSGKRLRRPDSPDAARVDAQAEAEELEHGLLGAPDAGNDFVAILAAAVDDWASSSV